MKAPRLLLRFASAKEQKHIESLASKAGLSMNNFIRQALGLEPLAHGGARENAGRRKPEETRHDNSILQAENSGAGRKDPKSRGRDRDAG